MSFTNLTFGKVAAMLDRGTLDLDDHATLSKGQSLYTLRIYLAVDEDPHAELMEMMQSASLHDVILYYAMGSAEFKEFGGAMKKYRPTEVEQLCRQAYASLTHIWGNVPEEEAAKAYDSLKPMERTKITGVVAWVLRAIALEEEKAGK